MICLRAKSIEEAVQLLDKYPNFSLLEGGSDLVLELKKKSTAGIIDISTLESLKYIKLQEKSIEIGALTTINTILSDKNIIEHFPLLSQACKSFASHQIRNIASLGGNVANDSPVADLIAPLLVLNTELILKGVKKKKKIFLEELFCGYKSLDLYKEIISSFIIPVEKHHFYYRKVGARASLNISKVSLAVVRFDDGAYRISGSSLNPYVQRFKNLEILISTKNYTKKQLKEALDKDIAPFGSFRSTKEYRKRVVFNMLQEALEMLRS